MEKLELTEEELAEKISQAVAEKEAELKKQHDSDMANLRRKAKEDTDNAIKKAKEEATLSADEIAQKRFNEQLKEKDDRLSFLEGEYKKTLLSKKLADAKVPSMFVNDSRLLNAKDNEVDSIIDTIKSEYNSTLPTGATINTNVGDGSGSKTPAKSEQELKFEEYRKNI